MKKIIILNILLLLLSCNKEAPLTAQEIIDLTIQKSNVSELNTAVLHFDFRDKHYEAHRNNGIFQLKRKFVTNGDSITDILSNDGFKRFSNNKVMSIQDSMAIKYSESVNSVHYFSVLPLGLNDSAVKKKLLSDASIKGKEYYKIQITFNQEGGGVDYNDVFIYWIEKNTFKINYLAYKFHVNGGGKRFRSVSSEFFVEGVRFVNYDNYKPKNKLAKLVLLDELFEKGELVKTSTIDLRNVKVTPLD